MTPTETRRAIISVSNKEGLADLARDLVAAGVEIYSTGGTSRHLAEAGIDVQEISAYTGFPELMDGRLKTLHPAVHGGILCRRDRADDREALEQHGIRTFDLVVINLYPFEATVEREGVTFDEAIEQIDIGGPTLIRAAAKNHAFVTVVTDPGQYSEVCQQLADQGGVSSDLRRRLAQAAFARTARYDQRISEYLLGECSAEFMGSDSDSDSNLFPECLRVDLRREASLRYGENPHQGAALYSTPGHRGASLVSARQLNGKPLSYNNLLDLDSALTVARSLPGLSAVVIKHNNPCGAATADTLADATRRAWEGDPVSAFGSVLGFNQGVDGPSAEVLTEPNRFVEAIVAPHFDPEALEILTTRPKWKDNVRLLAVGPLSDPEPSRQLRAIEGGYLGQQADVGANLEQEWKVVTQRAPEPNHLEDLRFAWNVCRHVKSNAIVLAQGLALVGVGAGQMSRVDSVEIAIGKAKDRSQGATLASDAFFPFADSIHRAAEAGVVAVIQPGGSRRDQEVIDACDQHELVMVFTGRRHFKH